MKVILLKDVPKLGRAGEVKEVADGYAQNRLIPNGLVEMATKSKIEALERKKEEAEAQHEAKEKEIIASLKSLNGKTITLQSPANDKGHLYRQVTAEAIQEAIKKETGHAIPISAILLDRPLKEIGEHPLNLKSSKVSSSITLQIKT